MPPKSWEVELKFHLDDPNELVARLEEMGFLAAGVEQHEDIYFRHPSRDFQQTGEAFRVRQMNDAACVTYKGPRQSGVAKAREEIELVIDGGEWPQWQTLLDRLGFQPLRPVRKQRRVFQGSFAAYQQTTVTIDSVEDLGLFAEVEIIVSDETNLPFARELITELSGKLGLERIEPRSYLSQVLEKFS